MALQNLIQRFKPQILFLSETKSKCEKMIQLRNRLNFAEVFTVECEGRKGGLSLLWTNLIPVTIFGEQ